MGLVLFNIQLEMFDSILVIFFKNFSCLGTYVYAKDNTPIHTLTHTARDRSDDHRQNLQSRFAKTKTKYEANSIKVTYVAYFALCVRCS